MTALHRRPGAASVAALGVITLTIATAHAVAPKWSQDFGFDVWHYSDYVEDHRQCDNHRRELESNHNHLLDQIAVGDRLVLLLIEQRISLIEAADEVARANEGRTGFVTSLASTHRDASTNQQRFARYLMRRVRTHLEMTGGTSRLAEVESRLEVEYRDLPSAP